MEALARIAGLCLCAAIVASVLRKDSPELGLLLVTAATLLGGALLLDAALELVAVGDELVELTGLSPSLFTPLLKVTAVAVVARIGGALCLDAGQSALARVLETAGVVCAFSCALPLLRAVIDLVRGWL